MFASMFPPTGLVVLLLSLACLGSGCAALERETVFSEIGDEGQRRVARPPEVGNPTVLRFRRGGADGATCHFGSDCASMVCEHHQCLNMGGPELQAPGELAKNP